MKRKSRITTCIIITLILAIFLSNFQSINASEQKNNEKNKYDWSNWSQKYTFSQYEKKIISQSTNISEKDGEKAANILSKLTKKEAYLEAVDEILEQYYQDDENISSELEDFTSNLNESANNIVEDYENAWKERLNSNNLDYTTDKILVAFDSTIENSEIEDILSKVADGGTVISGMYEPAENLPDEKKEKIEQIEKSAPTKTVSVNLKKSQTTKTAIETLEKIPGVKIAEVNNISKANSYAVDDGMYAFQWYVDDINLEDAWTSVDNANQANEIFVATLEPGIQLTHPDLKNNLLNRYSVDITGDSPVLLSSLKKPYLNEHGTYVAGILAATANNSLGVAGIAGIRSEQNNFECRLMTINCFKVDNDGDVTYDLADLVKAIEYAIAKGADVINMSLGSYGYTKTVDNAIQKAYQNGIVCIGAAGNDGITSSFYPAEYEHVISVISTDVNNKKSAYSNYGNKDISAPGESIYTTTIGNNYKYASGTSMAAPMVSATVALMKSVNYNLTPEQIERILYSTATDIGSKGYDEKTAHGLLNVGLAVRRAKWYTYKNEQPVIKSIKSTTNSITLKWNVIANEEQYEIWRSTSANGTYKKVKVINVDGKSSMYYKDTTAKSGTKYYYKIRCRNAYIKTGYKYSSYSMVSTGKLSNK